MILKDEILKKLIIKKVKKIIRVSLGIKLMTWIIKPG
jgi:hypothetical protein